MIFLHLDVSDLLDLANIEDKAKRVANDALRDLATQSHGHLVELVQSKLRSTREKYLNALSITQIDADVWHINLDAKAMFIEEGMQPHEMIDDLLQSPKAKRAADGSKYMAIPFEHNKKPTAMTQSQNSLTDTIKAEFKNRKIPYGKLEKDDQGQFKSGLLHSFDIKDKPLKTNNGPGQGKGPIGAPMQGPTGIPLLKGVRVYQRQVAGPDGKSKFQKAIMTFRMVSTKHSGTGRWVHPGLQPRHFFEETEKWALEQWDTKIKEKLFTSIMK